MYHYDMRLSGPMKMVIRRRTKPCTGITRQKPAILANWQEGFLIFCQWLRILDTLCMEA